MTFNLYKVDNGFQKSWEFTTIETISDTDQLRKRFKLHGSPPSKLKLKAAWYLFKSGYKPSWEANPDGGQFVIQVLVPNKDILDAFWLKITTALVEDRFGHLAKHILGAGVISQEKQFEISLWTRDAKNDRENKEVGRVLHEILYPVHYEFCYFSNQQKLKQRMTSAMAQPLYMI